jgi:phenylacetyl-CoA:acceptor oxidoreductase subunit 2
VGLLIVSTALAEGAGLCLLFTTAPLLLTWFGLALVLRAIAWTRYSAAVRSTALETPGKVLLQLGTVAALALAFAGHWVPAAAPLAGAAALATGWWLKFALVTRASINQGFALPHLPVRGTR